MNKEKIMEKANEHINDIFRQLMYQDKIIDGYDSVIVDNFREEATNVLFVEYSHGKYSPECKEKWQCAKMDIRQVYENGYKKNEWITKARSIIESDVVKKIINEQSYIQKLEYKNEFTQMFLKLFNEIKEDIRSIITLYVFRGNTARRDMFFS